MILKRKSTQSITFSRSPLSWFVFTHSDVASITLMILLIHVCIVWFVRVGDNITTCITLDLFKYIDILLKKIERLFKALKSTARSRICLEKSSAILFFSMSRNTNYVYGHLHKENISTPITIHWQPTHHYDQVLPKTTKAELLQGDYKKGLQEKIIAALVHSPG